MIYVFLAEGFEEIEALAAVDVLRRARLEVQTVGVGGRKITGSHGITVVCDLVDDEARIDGLEIRINWARRAFRATTSASTGVL